MHIGIDVTSLIYGRGVSRYTANLVRALVAQPGLELTLYGSLGRQRHRLEFLAEELVKNKNNAHVLIQAYPPKLQNIIWNWFGRNSIRSNIPKLDVFHSWDWLQPPDKDLPLVSTIHDLAILKYPDTAHQHILKMHRQSWQQLKERGAQIIAVSRATKKDIVELLEIPPYQVHVIYEALPMETKLVSERLTEEEYDEIKQRLNLSRPFIFFVGTREPRKNLQRLIEAWEPLKNEIDLLIAGDKGWDSTSKESSRFSLPNLRFLGKVSEEELAVLYGEASMLAYPCLYEGFGLPILEAFYHGTPVITSSVSSMIEVAGNAAELVDPESVESIRQGITTILNEDLTAQQKRLQRMIIRLQMFDWRQVAIETMKVYRLAKDQFLGT
ncbi:MAG TPA: glycosyltransferase family 1 protein [Vitreimonas sp.]|nr:glycosyltransferase family 1 protein [Vitreimonas sp.]